MQIKLLYFAQLKEAAQVDEETVTVEHPVTVGEVVHGVPDLDHVLGVRITQLGAAGGGHAART